MRPMRRDDWAALAAIALFYAALESMGITCPIRYVTGISCPGCGMSRAWLSLLRLDWAGAFAFHPLFWTPPLAAALLFFRRRIPERLFRLGMGIMGALFVGVYFLRLFAPEDTVVVFRPSQGLIGRIFFRAAG